MRRTNLHTHLMHFLVAWIMQSSFVRYKPKEISISSSSNRLQKTHEIKINSRNTRSEIERNLNFNVSQRRIWLNSCKTLLELALQVALSVDDVSSKDFHFPSLKWSQLGEWEKQNVSLSSRRRWTEERKTFSFPGNRIYMKTLPVYLSRNVKFEISFGKCFNWKEFWKGAHAFKHPQLQHASPLIAFA